MPTQAKTDANRRNAARSTGPRTRGGKERSSANSLRHGLTKSPAQSEVMEWYHLITGEALHVGQQPLDEKAHAALELARAEAQLHRTMLVEQAFLKDLSEESDLTPHLRRIRETLEIVHRSIPGVSPAVERILLARRKKVPEKITHKVKEIWTAPHRYLERLGQYRKSAEVRRHKALQRWIEVDLEEIENEPKLPQRLKGARPSP